MDKKSLLLCFSTLFLLTSYVKADDEPIDPDKIEHVVVVYSFSEAEWSLRNFGVHFSMLSGNNRSNSRQQASNDSEDQDNREGEGVTCNGSDDKNNLVGNPIAIASGNKIQPETDYISGSPFPLSIEKTYNNFAARTGIFGNRWLSNFDYKLLYTKMDTCVGTPTPSCFNTKMPDPQKNITIIKADGAKRIFIPSGPLYPLEWQDNDFGDSAKITLSNDGFFSLREMDGIIEVYNLDGKIVSRTHPAGYKHTYNYDSNSFLTSVISSTGDSLSLYYTNGRVSKIVDGKGNQYLYQYSNNRLAKQIMPDGNYKEFFYTDTNWPNALTQINVNGAVYAKFTYHPQRALLTKSLRG